MNKYSSIETLYLKIKLPIFLTFCQYHLPVPCGNEERFGWKIVQQIGIQAGKIKGKQMLNKKYFKYY